ncbi:uncharacterized protein LOC135173038 [Diachasmimorpha longicaudata]|uniref:uncharacterized protein LOC135173038 n=1 Tax=Diachasmimorpha longicaudata TaxID=58733 RepID=UPI0030B8AE84
MDSVPFFLNITEALISGLENDKEKSVANAWIEKIKDIADMELQLKYMKILIFCLQKNLLMTSLGKSVPQNSKECMKTLDNWSKFFTSTETNSGHTEEHLGKIYTTTSGDLHEYFAIQEVGETLIQGYYGISSDVPLLKNLFETADFNMIVNDDETFIINEIDDLMQETNSEENDNIKELCQCRLKGKHKVSIASRPSWGRKRYMERLIDQSPHTVGDLEVPAVNAMLHNFRSPRG